MFPAPLLLRILTAVTEKIFLLSSSWAQLCPEAGFELNISTLPGSSYSFRTGGTHPPATDASTVIQITLEELQRKLQYVELA